MVKWCKISHNYNNIQCNMYGFIDSTFRPKPKGGGGPSSGIILYNILILFHKEILFRQGLFIWYPVVSNVELGKCVSLVGFILL